MNTSRDVKALFERFGGDATVYKEIRMENEACDARGRWPLLSMTDPREVSLPAAGAPGDRSQAALIRAAPFFVHAPRRDVSPVMETKMPVTPQSSTFRFSPPPGKVEASEDSNEIQPQANCATASCEPVAQAVLTARTLPGVPVSTGTAPLRKLFNAAMTTANEASAQPGVAAEKSARLDALFDRLRKGGSDTKPAAALKADAPARPWFLGGAGQE